MRSRVGAALLLGVAAGLLASAPAAATTISGFVTDAAAGEPLHNATVAVVGQPLGALTNISGYYAVSRIPPGTLVLQFSHIGYGTRRDTVDVPADGAMRLDVQLQSESILLAEETVVEGSREQVGRAAQTSFQELRIQTVQDLPAVGEADLLRSLQLLPGIQSASDISSGLYVRGGGPDQNLILLDDMPLYNPSHAFGFFSTFNPDAVKEASLYKGAYPAAYGGNLGAVLDVANRDGNRQQVSGSGGISLVSGRLLVEGPAGNGAWMASVRRTYLDAVLASLRAADVDVPSYYFYDFNFKANQRLSRRDNLVVSAFWSQDDLRFDSDRETYLDLDWGNRSVAARLERIVSPSLFARLLVGQSRYTSTTAASFFDTPVRFVNGVVNTTVRGDIDYAAGRGHSIAAGAAVTRYRFDYEQAFNREQQTDLDERPARLSAYVQDEWNPDNLTTIRVGARVEHFSAGDRWAVMPRAGLSRALAPGLRFKVSGGTYRQYLQLVATEGFSGADFWVPLDSSVEPGRSRQGVVGLEWDPSRSYRFSIEGYYTDLDDLVVLDNTVSADSPDSDSQSLFKADGQGQATGIELFAEKRAGRWRGWVGYTLAWTERRFAELNQGEAFPPKYDRRHDVSVVSRYQLGRYTLGASFVYGSGQAFTPAAARYSMRSPATGEVNDYVLPAPRNSARLLPYHRLDISGRRALTLFGAGAEAYLQIFNVYSRRNEWFVQYDTDNPETAPEVVKMLPIVPTFGVEFSF